MAFTVRALQKTGPDEPFQIAEIERRDPRPDDIVIDIKAAGVCHSDIHTIRNEWGEAHFPLTVGHEIAGVVSAVGADVTRWAVGDRVGVGCLVNSCQQCAQCRDDQEQFCENGSVGTYNSTDVDGSITQGGYAEKVVVNERFALRIPEEIGFLEAAPLLCAGITTFSPIDHWGVKAGDSVAVVGLGGLGHMAVQIAAAKGAEVTVLSRTTAKEADALALGATRLLATDPAAEEDAADSEPVDAPVRDFFSEHAGEFDVILNTISAEFNLTDYLRLLKPRGAMVLVGLPPEGLRLPTRSLIGGSRVLAGSAIGGIAQTQQMLDFCAEHGIAAKVEVIGVDEVDTAYDRLVRGDVRFRFVIDTATFDR